LLEDADGDATVVESITQGGSSVHGIYLSLSSLAINLLSCCSFLGAVTLQALQHELVALRRRVDDHETKLGQNTRKLDDLSDSVAMDRMKNIYAFADQCERQDFASNLTRSHCVLITGIEY
jgi:hypothetical protein